MSKTQPQTKNAIIFLKCTMVDVKISILKHFVGTCRWKVQSQNNDLHMSRTSQKIEQIKNSIMNNN
jgi:hypothetical protein